MEHHPDLEKLQALFPHIREYQKLAAKHGIGDVFQDNGGKLLQTLLILNMEGLGCREGNDCRDADGNEYELKSINILLTSGVSTHHHLNPTILKKYRAVKAWYFSAYRGIELTEMWRVETTALEPWFKAQEKKWRKSGGRDINNPKIPLKFVREVGKLVYSSPAIDDEQATPNRKRKRRYDELMRHLSFPSPRPSPTIKPTLPLSQCSESHCDRPSPQATLAPAVLATRPRPSAQSRPARSRPTMT